MEVTNRFDKQFAGSWSISSDRFSRIYPRKSIALKDNLRSIKVLSQNAAVAGSDGLTRAAAGAALGFLVAGPVGTVLGAGAGAGGAKRGTLETYSIIVSFKSGEVILGDVTAFELESLREYLPLLNDVSPAPAQPIIPVQPIAPPAALNPPSKQAPASSGLPPAIRGRKTKRMPMGALPLLDWLGDPGEDVTLRRFRWHLTTALDSLNTIKWRHYDQQIEEDEEIIGCTLLAISVMAGSAASASTEEQESLQRYVSNRISNEQFKIAWSQPLVSAEMSRARAEKIINSAQEKKARLTKQVQKSEAKCSTPEGSASELESASLILKTCLTAILFKKTNIVQLVAKRWDYNSVTWLTFPHCMEL